MKQYLPITFILLFFSILGIAQSPVTVLKGKIIDQETKEGIAFVSIGIEGTYSGTATNPDGNFELKVPEEYLSKNLYFSAIGYKNISQPISGFSSGHDILIALVPQSYDIAAVEVAAESKVLQRILRTASERIPQNYLSTPANIKIYYEQRKSVNQAASKTAKAIVDLYDANGYAHPSWKDAFNHRTYRVTENQTSEPLFTFGEGATNLDELLEMDLARLSNTIMSPKLLNDFRLKMEAQTRFNGDSVWIISYVATKLDLAHTGSFYPTSFKGKIYISKTNYAVLRNEISLTETKASLQGRSLAVKNRANLNLQTNITTAYKKLNGKYILAHIDAEKQYTSPDNQSVYESGKMVTLGIETKNIKPIDKRDYFVQAKQNEAFWQNFVTPPN